MASGKANLVNGTQQSPSHEETSSRQQQQQPKSPFPLHLALVAPDRVKALELCDRNLMSYNDNSFLLIFRFRGRHFQMIAAPLLCLLLWDIGWALYLVHFQEQAYKLRGQIQRMESLITPLLTPVSFLLVFRLGRAAVRYWDARAAVGKIIETCRTMSSTALVGCRQQALFGTTTSTSTSSDMESIQRQQELAQDFVRWIAVFPIAVKNFLRPHEGQICDRIKEVGDVLTLEDCELLLQAKGEDNFAPVLVLNRLRQVAMDACTPSSCTTLPGQYHQMDAVRAVLYRQLNEQIDILTGAWGAMERISGTPLPFVYVVHLRTFLLLYLFLWNVEAIASKGWIALVPLMLASWGLLGIEAAAVECERPFQWNSNHLALGKACLVVSRCLAQTMENTGWLEGASASAAYHSKVEVAPV